MDRVSDCCSAQPVGESEDMGICPECKEHCEYVGEDEDDIDMHAWFLDHWDQAHSNYFTEDEIGTWLGYLAFSGYNPITGRTNPIGSKMAKEIDDFRQQMCNKYCKQLYWDVTDAEVVELERDGEENPHQPQIKSLGRHRKRHPLVNATGGRFTKPKKKRR